MTKAQRIREAAEDATGHIGILYLDAELAVIGATVGNSRCYCDECAGETEHDGTSVILVSDRALDGDEGAMALAISDVSGYRRPGRVLVVVASTQYGETGCSYDAGEQLLRDPVVVGIIAE